MNMPSDPPPANRSPRSSPWIAAPPAWGRADLLALLFWTVAIVAIFRDAVLFGKAFFYFDITEINFPYRDFLAREIRAGRFSRWHPGLYCGLPLFSESQAGYFHPIKYLFLPWMETWRAFNLDTVGSIWLTGLGAYVWLRRRVGAIGALSGAAVFGLSGYVWGHLIHTSMLNAVASVPIVFWAVEDVWETGRSRGLAIGAAAFAIQIFAGHLQDSLLTAGAVALYALDRAALERDRRGRVRALGAAFSPLAAGILIAGAQWLPSKELLDRSPRAAGLSWEDQILGSWSPELIPTLLLREAYGTRARDTDWLDGFYPYHEMNCYMGIVGLGLAIAGAAAFRDRWAGFWVLISIVGLALMLGRFTVLFDHARHLPFIGSMRIPVRFHLWVSLGIAALAAVGADRLARPGFVSLRAVAWGIGALAAVSIMILIYIYIPFWTRAARWTNADQVRRSHWLSRELAIGAARATILAACAWTAARRAGRSTDAKRRGRIASILPVLALLDLAAAHRDEAPTIDPRYWTDAPESARRIAGDRKVGRVFGFSNRSAGEPGYAWGKANLFEARDCLAWSLPPVWGLSSSGGHTPIISTRCKLYTDFAKPGRGRYDVEGVTHLLWSLPRLPQPIPGFGATSEKAGSVYIFRNAATLPRARLMGAPLYARDENDAAALLSSAGRSIRDRPIVEDPDRPLPTTRRARGTAEIRVDSPERIELETASDDPSYLVLTDTFDPGWRATVDGDEKPIRPAYVAFRAVFLQPGKHIVIFTYTPKYYREGLATTATGCVWILIALVWPWRRKRPKPGGAGERPRFWALGALVLFFVLTIGSIFIPPPASSTADLDRWRTAWHRFTWSARLDAMKPPR